MIVVMIINYLLIFINIIYHYNLPLSIISIYSSTSQFVHSCSCSVQ